MKKNQALVKIKNRKGRIKNPNKKIMIVEEIRAEEELEGEQREEEGSLEGEGDTEEEETPEGSPLE